MEQGSVKRLQSLDVLRGVAVLLVLGRHILYIPSDLPFQGTLFFQFWRAIGWIGVDLFFVLSGFLVSGLLFDEYQKRGSINIVRFLIRRGFKIYPSFYLFLVATLFTSTLYSVPFPFEWSRVVGEATFLQNYVGAFWTHTWSLSVEEHFYGALCLLFSGLLCARVTSPLPFRHLPTIILWSAVFVLIARMLVGYQNPPGDWRSTLGYSHLRIDSLFFGVLISYWYRFYKDELAKHVMRNRRNLAIAVAATICVPLLFPINEGRFTYTLGFTVVYLGCGALLLRVLFGSAKRSPMLTPTSVMTAALGRYSYSVYLWHMLVYQVVERRFVPEDSQTQFIVCTAFYLVGSVGIGVLMARLVEFPALRVRDKFFPSDAGK